MKNIVSTIPKGRFKTWELAERVVRQCDGETLHQGEKWFWTIFMVRAPKESLIGSLCYMVYDGQIRGYFDIVDLDTPDNWDYHEGKDPNGKVCVMANWHPVSNAPGMTGFQGWRYTALRP